MKSFAILAVAASAVVAQQLSDLPPCGQTCVGNMLSIAASSFGCQAGDAVCYCSNQDFGNGVRDCANEACPSADAGTVITFGVQYCAAILASAGTTGSALAPLTSALSTVTTVDLATITGTGSMTTATTDALASSVLSSLDSAASSASGSLASAASSVAASLSSARSSALASVSGAASSALSSGASVVSSALSSGASELSSVASSLGSEISSIASQATAASTGGAPMITGLPFAGAAGMAAWLLL